MYLKISLGLAFSLFVVLHTKAQHLRHKGSLGIEYTEASDSLLNAWKIVESRGILVKTVTPGYTAAILGIQPNDILVSINNTDSLYLFDFKELEQNLQEKDPISITFIRKNRKNRVVGYVSAGPREKSAGEVLYDEIAYHRGYLRTIIHKPSGNAPFPTVFFVQDYDCGSIDFSQDTLSPTKQLVDGWVKAGYVVVRVEKPGVGESEGTKDCARIDYQEELTAFQNTYELIKKLSFVDSTHVFLFGHSVGGITAPLVAAKAKYKPRGIMVYGTVIKPWFEYMLDVFRKQPVLFKESLQSIEVNTRMMTPLLYEWLVQGRSASELFSVPDFEAILTSKENPLQYYRGTFFGRSSNYFSDINRFNLTQTWAQVAVPTLAIHGEYDSQAISSEAAQSIAQIINELYPKKGSYKLLRGTDHSMVKMASFNEYQQLVRSGKYQQHAYNNFNPEIIEMTVNWMKQQ